MSALELGAAPAEARDGVSSSVARSLNHVMAIANSVDPNSRRVSFVGFKDNVAAEARVASITAFLANFPHYPAAAVNHEYKGPRGDRKMKDVSYAEFASP